MLIKESGQTVEDKGLNLSAEKGGRSSMNKENVITFRRWYIGL